MQKRKSGALPSNEDKLKEAFRRIDFYVTANVRLDQTIK